MIHFKLSTNLNALFILVLASLLQACGGGDSAKMQPINIDGSSTVYPITNSIAKDFNSQAKNPVDVNVGFSGSIGGFEKFCAGETDINNASVPIPKNMMAKCKNNNVAYIELPIAFDAITVVTNPQNDWAKTMTVEELKSLWQPSAEKKITKWSQINPQWPNQTINLFGPGRDSGTFEYFTIAIIGQEGASRNDYVSSEDDEAIVNGVIQDPNAIGYFGYAYYEQNQDKLQAVAVDDDNGGILPSADTIKDNSYRPLTRPLFIYINAKKAQDNPALAEFVEFYLKKASEVVPTVGYVALPDSAYHVANIHFEKNKTGTVFNGQPVINATIGELLTKTYASEGKDGYVF